MQISTVNNVQAAQNGEKEDDVLQALAMFGYLALDNARGRIA